MKLADQIRSYARERYVKPAKEKKQPRFSIRMGDVVQGSGIGSRRAPAVCSALRTHQFLEENNLRLVESSGPKSGQSTTVTYTYEFVATLKPAKEDDPWITLRGALKDIYAELGGGEKYLREERSNFFPAGHSR
jgi:hypothetical protein